MNFKTLVTLSISICIYGLISLGPSISHAQNEEQNLVSASTDIIDLTGNWLLDKKASDDVKSVMAANSRKKGGGGGHGGGMGGGGGRGGGGHGGGMDNNSGGQNQERMMKNIEDLEKELSRLEIFQTGHEFNVTDGMDMTRLIFTDGRENKIWTMQGEALATATWTGRTLKIQIQSGKKKRGQVRHYTLSEDGSKLTVLFKRSMGPGGEPKTIRMVYRRG